MKKIAGFVMLLLAGGLRASFPTDAFDVFVNPGLCAHEGTFIGFASTMTQSGTLPINSVSGPNSGNYDYGIFSDSNYANWSATDMTDMHALAQGGIIVWVYPTSLTNQPVLWSYTDSVQGTTWVQAATGYVKIETSLGIDLSNSASTLNINQWNEVAFVYSTTTLYLYVNGTLEASESSGGYAPATVTNGQFGRFNAANSFALNGYETQLRFLNAVPSSYPVTDTYSCSNSPTYTPTISPTFSISPTYTETPTPFETNTPNMTYTPMPKAFTTSSPPMGIVITLVNGENTALVEQEAAAEASILKPHGYNWLQTDTYNNSRLTNGQLTTSASTIYFPGITTYVHSQGLLDMGYTSMGDVLCDASAVGTFDQPSSLTNDANTFENVWHWDGVKADWCFSSGANNNTNPQTQYTIFQNALYNAGQPIFLNACDSGYAIIDGGNPWIWAPSIANTWRIWDDVVNSYAGYMTVFRKDYPLYSYSHAGAFNDPDIIWTGASGANSMADQTDFAQKCIENSPLMIYDWEEIQLGGGQAGIGGSLWTTTTAAIVNNDSEILVDQDTTYPAGNIVWGSEGNGVIIAKRISGTMKFSVLMTNDDVSLGTMTFTYASLSLTAAGAQAGPALVKNINPLSNLDQNAGMTLGSYSTSYSQYVTPASSVMLTFDFGAEYTATPTPTSTPTWSCIPTYTPSVTLTMLGTQTPFPSYTSTPVLTATPSLTVLGSATPFPTSTPFCYYCIPPTATVTPIPWWNQYNP